MSIFEMVINSDDGYLTTTIIVRDDFTKYKHIYIHVHILLYK